MSRSRRVEVLVIGAGPAGLAAAAAAADVGKQVLLLDQNPRLGGQIWRHRAGDALPGNARAAIDAAAPPVISVAPCATVVDVISPHELVVSFAGRIARVEAGAVVLATGAVERLLPFPGWTLPGVVGVGGLQALVKNGLPVAGMRVVLAGSGPLLLPVAATLSKAGADLLLIGEQANGAMVRRFAMRALASPGRAVQAASLRWASRAAPYRTDCWPLRATGDDRIKSVVMQIGNREKTVDCDWLATNAGLVPRTELASLLGCRVGSDGIAVDARQQTSVAGVFAAGECCGVKGDAGAVAEGQLAGIAAAGVDELPPRLVRQRTRARRFETLLGLSFALRRELLTRITDDTIICRCEDVRRDQLDPRWEQRQAKLWTRVGMGACQGVVCGAACQALFGWERNSVRPPLEQLPLEAWASGISLPVAAPPTTDEHAATTG